MCTYLHLYQELTPGSVLNVEVQVGHKFHFQKRKRTDGNLPMTSREAVGSAHVPTPRPWILLGSVLGVEVRAGCELHSQKRKRTDGDLPILRREWDTSSVSKKETDQRGPPDS